MPCDQFIFPLWTQPILSFYLFILSNLLAPIPSRIFLYVCLSCFYLLCHILSLIPNNIIRIRLVGIYIILHVNNDVLNVRTVFRVDIHTVYVWLFAQNVLLCTDNMLPPFVGWVVNAVLSPILYHPFRTRPINSCWLFSLPLSLSFSLSKCPFFLFLFTFDMFIIFIFSYYYCFVCISVTFSSRPLASSLEIPMKSMCTLHTHVLKCIQNDQKGHFPQHITNASVCVYVCLCVYLRDVLFVCLFVFWCVLLALLLLLLVLFASARPIRFWIELAIKTNGSTADFNYSLGNSVTVLIGCTKCST